VVADIGELVRDVFGVEPVYAATASLDRCPHALMEPPWPRPGPWDAYHTARRTGLDASTAWMYHSSLIRFDYNPSALYKALALLEAHARQQGRATAPALAGEPARSL
jgi:predicted solute-binding protein